MKSEALDVYVSNLFRNAKTKQTHYVVIYGFFGKAWALKASFLRTYLHVLARKMNSVKAPKLILIIVTHIMRSTQGSMNLVQKVYGVVWHPKMGKRGTQLKG